MLRYISCTGRLRRPRLDHRFAADRARVQRAAHALADHVEETRGLPGDQHVALAEHVAVDQRRPEILGAAFVVGVRVQPHAVLFGEIVRPRSRACGVEIVAALEADADDLPAVAGVAPGVMPQAGMEPEMEILGVERAIDDVVELLPDEKPRNLLRVVRIDRADHQRAGPVGADHLARAVFDRLAVSAARGPCTWSPLSSSPANEVRSCISAPLRLIAQWSEYLAVQMRRACRRRSP